MPNSTINTLASLPNENKVFYDRQLLAVAEPLCAYRRHAQKTKLPQHEGNTVNWRDMKKLEKNPVSLTEGVVPDGKKLNIDAIEATVKPYGDFVRTTDHIELMAVDKVVMHATKRLALQASETLDYIAGSEFCSGNSVYYSGGVASRSALGDDNVLDFRDIIKVAQFLKGNSAPTIDGSYWAVVHPAVAYDLMVSATENGSWMDLNKYADPQKIVKGEIGTLFGVRFVETPNAITVEADGKTVYQTLVYGDDAFGCVDLAGGNLQTFVKPLGSAGTADPLNMFSTIGWKAFDACKILNNDFMVRIESCSKFAVPA